MNHNLYYIIQAWKKEKPEFIKKLKHRLYNEVINESN